MLRSSLLSLLLAFLAVKGSTSFLIHGLTAGRRSSEHHHHGSSRCWQPVSATKHIAFEYCTGCRWDLRSVWLAQELAQHSPHVNITLVPSNEPGTLRITSSSSYPSSNEGKLLYEKSKGAPFPEPTKAVLDRWVQESTSNSAEKGRGDTPKAMPDTTFIVPQPLVTFTFGPSDRLRSWYLAQEILRTFADELKAVSLLVSTDTPSLYATIGDEVYEWGQPDTTTSTTKDLKQWVRDRIVPDKHLGHSDAAVESVDEMDDDEAAEARKFFGVM